MKTSCDFRTNSNVLLLIGLYITFMQGIYNHNNYIPQKNMFLGYMVLQLLLLLLLLLKRYNLYKVMACSTTFFHLSLLCATFFQFLMFMLFISSKTSSSQRVLGLPIGLLDMSFNLLIICTTLSSAMRSTWPNRFNFCFLINPIIFCPFNISFIFAVTLFTISATCNATSRETCFVLVH